jgi:hypothetical protein
VQVTSISWKENELNMVDTPGHADFGGEVSLHWELIAAQCVKVLGTILHLLNIILDAGGLMFFYLFIVKCSL